MRWVKRETWAVKERVTTECMCVCVKQRVLQIKVLQCVCVKQRVTTKCMCMCVKRDVTVVLDVLRLLPVTLRLPQRLNDQRGGEGHHRHLGLTVLDRQLDHQAKALPVLGSFLGYVFSNLLRGETQWTDLRSQ